jgi:hypothetical protein
MTPVKPRIKHNIKKSIWYFLIIFFFLLLQIYIFNYNNKFRTWRGDEFLFISLAHFRLNLNVLEAFEEILKDRGELYSPYLNAFSYSSLELLGNDSATIKFASSLFVLFLVLIIFNYLSKIVRTEIAFISCLIIISHPLLLEYYTWYVSIQHSVTLIFIVFLFIQYQSLVNNKLSISKIIVFTVTCLFGALSRETFIFFLILLLIYSWIKKANIRIFVLILSQFVLLSPLVLQRIITGRSGTQLTTSIPAGVSDSALFQFINNTNFINPIFILLCFFIFISMNFFAFRSEYMFIQPSSSIVYILNLIFFFMILTFSNYENIFLGWISIIPIFGEVVSSGVWQYFFIPKWVVNICFIILIYWFYQLRKSSMLLIFLLVSFPLGIYLKNIRGLLLGYGDIVENSDFAFIGRYSVYFLVILVLMLPVLLNKVKYFNYKSFWVTACTLLLLNTYSTIQIVRDQKNTLSQNFHPIFWQINELEKAVDWFSQPYNQIIADFYTPDYKLGTFIIFGDKNITRIN